MDLYDQILDSVKHIDDFDEKELKDFKNAAEMKIFANIDDEDCDHKNTVIIKDKEICGECGIEIICEHKETEMVNNIEMCTECGVIMKENSSYEKYFSSGDKYSKDPTRCHKRKSDQKRTINKDVEGMDFPESIVKSANKKYQLIIGNDIYRGAKRKAIIIACLYFAYLSQGESRTVDEISHNFGVKKKNVKGGFTKYYEKFPDAKNEYITSKHLIRRVMILANINFTHLKKINRLCDYLDNSSALLNRSNPQSVAASIVYLYLCLEPDYKARLCLSKLNFSKIVGLSDITITKLGKEAQTIIGNESVKI